MNSSISIYTTKPSKDYELLDSGGGEKLERFGNIILRRPDPQVLWDKSLPNSIWQSAAAHFDKQWLGRKKVPESWNIYMGAYQFKLKLSAFKHVGIFPEQESNWNFISETISKASKPVSVLNLFGYTGGTTLAALLSNANVVHVDGSKTALSWAKENTELSGLSDKSVRWILDDALSFVKREIKRGHVYDAVVMDPPAFGHGPTGETWKIEQHLPELIGLLPKLLSKKPLFVLVNGYASGYSPLAYRTLLDSLTALYGGTVDMGEVAIEEKDSKRLLPAGIFARWTRE